MLKNFDFAKMEAEAVASRGRWAQRRAEGSAMLGFTPTDLGDWMALCDRAGVAAVPAIKVAEGESFALLKSVDQPGGAEATDFWREVEQAKATFGPGWMMRWSCCSCIEVKHRLGVGKPEWHQDLLDLFFVADMRAYDLIFEHPLERIAAWARPWVQFDILDGFPIEYRVFVENNEIVGISNYYLQRPLPDTAQTQEDLRRVRDATQRLIAAQTKPINCPQAGEPIHRGIENWFSADFARLPSGAILFLEGGPAHFARGGAHPCCFPMGNVHGVALALREQDSTCPAS
jgi:hypothetical protein